MQSSVHSSVHSLSLSSSAKLLAKLLVKPSASTQTQKLATVLGPANLAAALYKVDAWGEQRVIYKNISGFVVFTGVKLLLYKRGVYF